AKAAADDADGPDLQQALSTGARLRLAQRDLDGALTMVKGIHDGLLQSAGPTAGGFTGMVLAEVALSAGHPADAFAAASGARASLAGDAAGDAAWLEGWAAYQLGRPAAVQAAAAAATGAHQQALRALGNLAAGQPASAEAPFPMEGLTDREMASLAVEAARG